MDELHLLLQHFYAYPSKKTFARVFVRFMDMNEDEEEIVYAAEIGSELVGSTEEVLNAGFVVDEGQEDLMNNVFGEVDSADADAYED